MSSAFDTYYHTVTLEPINFSPSARYAVSLRKHFPCINDRSVPCNYPGEQFFRTRQEAEKVLARLKLEYHID